MDIAALAADDAVAGWCRPFDIEYRRQPSVHLRLAAIEGVVLAHEAAQRPIVHVDDFRLFLPEDGA